MAMSLYIRFSMTFGVRYIQGSCVLDLSSQHLTELPAELSTQETCLNISYNDFSIICSNMFSALTNLTIIRLDKNQISTIEPGAFNGSFPLQYLYLNVNILEIIEANVFASLTHLRELHLDQNKIKTLEKGAFIGLFNLRSLYLHSNALEVLLSEVFGSLNQLTQLWLCINKISVIENGSFVGLVKLRHLCLHTNKLVEVPHLSLLKNLRHIYLAKNPIQSLSANDIKQLENVTRLSLGSKGMIFLPPLSTLLNIRHLTLSNMLLKRLPRHVLKGVHTLTFINLSWNKLMHFPELGGSVVALEKLYLRANRILHIPSLRPYMGLKYLDLSRNYITMISEADLSHMGSGRLNLDSNPIPCVHQLCWLLASDLQVTLTCRDGSNWNLLDPSYVCEGWLSTSPDIKVHGANMGPLWGRQDPGGPMLAPWTLLSGSHQKHLLWLHHIK